MSEQPERRGPWRWAVTWGVLARPGFVVVHVTAFDADEALVLAAGLRPDLPRPLVAFLARSAARRDVTAPGAALGLQSSPDEGDDVSDLFSIAGKTALVTGGSRGIGEMIVRGFVDAGVKVYLSSRKADVCEALAEELRDAGWRRRRPSLRTSRPSTACAALAGELESRERQLDILVNNAGATWGAPLEEFDEAAWERVLSLNVKGVFFTTRYLLPLLEAASTEPTTPRGSSTSARSTGSACRRWRPTRTRRPRPPCTSSRGTSRSGSRRRSRSTRSRRGRSPPR